MNIIADSTRVCNTEIHNVDQSPFLCYYIKRRLCATYSDIVALKEGAMKNDKISKKFVITCISLSVVLFISAAVMFMLAAFTV